MAILHLCFGTEKNRRLGSKKARYIRAFRRRHLFCLHIMERATRLELASRHPANGEAIRRNPASPRDWNALRAGRGNRRSAAGGGRSEAISRKCPVCRPRQRARDGRHDGERRMAKRKSTIFSDGAFWSGRRGSNSLPRPWQGRALPDELRPHMAPVFQHHGASGRSRTNDTRIFSPLLYQLSYRGKWRPRWGSNPRPPA